MKFLLILLMFSLFIVSESLNCDNPTDGHADYKLKKKLFCNDYDKEIRPGKSNEVTNISFRYTIKSFDYEENVRTLSVTSWMTLGWMDTRLSWTPSDYSDIQTIHVDIDSIWRPDIYLYNSHIGSGVGTCQPDVDCLIQHDGKTVCVMPCEHIGHCYIGDYTNWPFDRQNCSFTFGSWMKTGEEMNYQTEKLKLISNRAKQNNQWKLLSAKARVNPGKYAVAPNETYPSVVFTFLIERHSAYHISGVIVPSLILLICNLTVLCMIPDCLERFILVLGNLFSHFLYLEFLYWMLPWSGDSIPNVLIFFRDSQLISCFILIESVIIKALIFKSKNDRPFLWVQSTVTLATSNPVGEFLLTPVSQKIEDATDLVESSRKLSSDEIVWMSFCKLIDRVLFVVFFIIYFFMVFSLLPNGYLKGSYDEIETLN